MSGRGFRVRALGEVAIRCADVARMARFYEEVIGLERATRGDEPVVFFRIAEGYGGHTATLALFRNDQTGRPGLHPTSDEAPLTGARSSLHHVALSLPYEEQEAAMSWYDRIGQPYRVEIFGSLGWRGIFTQDPEGNTVELVAQDDSLRD